MSQALRLGFESQKTGMKIIIITISLELGGAEHRALKLARYFKQRGFDVELWGFNGPGVLSEYCQDEGIPCRLIPFYWSRRPRIMLANFKRLLYALRQANPDILLPHTILPIIACGFLWRWSGAKRCVGYVGGKEFGLIDRRAEMLAAHMVTGIICNAGHLAESLSLAYQLPKRKITVIRNGIDLPSSLSSRIELRRRLGLETEAFLAVMVANLSGFKNQEGLIKTWHLVLQALPSHIHKAELLLAGKDFGYGELLKQTAHQLGIEPHVVFLGYVQDVPDLLAAVDLCVFSSPYEGSPNGILEAMAGGLAVAAVDNPGVREVVGEHQYPWLSTDGDHEAFAQNIIALMQDENLRKTLGIQNQQRIKDEFSLDKMCQSTESLVLS